MFIAATQYEMSKPCLTKEDALVSLLVKSVKVTDTDIVIHLSTKCYIPIVVTYSKQYFTSIEAINYAVMNHYKSFDVILSTKD